MTNEGTQLRLFVAIELPDEVRDRLARVQDGLRQAGADRLRWVRPEGIHLTLKFLGSVAEARAPAIAGALSAAIEPFELRLQPDGLGGFGGSRLRVVWVGLEGDTEALAQLAGRIETALEPLGFPRETRPFAAHLTVARVRDEATPQERRRLGEIVAAHQIAALPPMIVSSVSLMRSALQPGGAVYTRLASFPAGSRPDA